MKASEKPAGNESLTLEALTHITETEVSAEEASFKELKKLEKAIK